MSLKFTTSQDGIERATVLVPLRISREDLKDIKRAVKKEEGETWREWLASHAALGVEEGLMTNDGDMEQRYGRGGD